LVKDLTRISIKGFTSIRYKREQTEKYGDRKMNLKAANTRWFHEEPSPHFSGSHFSVGSSPCLRGKERFIFLKSQNGWNENRGVIGNLGESNGGIQGLLHLQEGG